MNKEFKKEDFDEDCPRFIPFDEAENAFGWYIFDTEKLDYLGFSHYYGDIHECDRVCDILNTIDYLLKEQKND